MSQTSNEIDNAVARLGIGNDDSAASGPQMPPNG